MEVRPTLALQSHAGLSSCGLVQDGSQLIERPIASKGRAATAELPQEKERIQRAEMLEDVRRPRLGLGIFRAALQCTRGLYERHARAHPFIACDAVQLIHVLYQRSRGPKYTSIFNHLCGVGGPGKPYLRICVQ